jgi:putative tricarboxylic transport membrane protein
VRDRLVRRAQQHDRQLIFGVVGYVFKKLDYPLAPLVLALVLGDLAENALRQSLIMSQGSLAIFVSRPIAGAITAVAVFFFVLPVLTPWWRRLRGTATPAPQQT